ncbi:Chaperone modulatory protein CbpM [BD1-7 clade bacterium]|uniref:Chaperone modulatory protein CbpM n=1 Tax=BD1-7 clade bacterium TaxID=2029982 RepID=A0A5S9N7F0_9GAMM|nr:Chaperone modulatory protein CbpM [BD1-7 clade bacterium]CAA0081945.1 Chaperone modulatory protein CbpM [BD1-7 clade bacterium]CAA0085261.1 Chaperone modulatory protein CbpM [BD1-7 clade bacterium]
MTEAVMIEMDVIEVCEMLSVSQKTLIAVVDEGIVEPDGITPEQWVFSTQMVSIVRKACRLNQELGVDWPGVALALQLMDELEYTKLENQRLRQQLHRFINT